MNEEQEGVELFDPEAEGVELPDVDLEDTEPQVTEDNVGEEVDDVNDINADVKEEKTSKESELMKALNAERAERKRLQKENKALKSKKQGTSTYDTLIKEGVSESLAKTLAEAIDRPGESERVAELEFTTALVKTSKKEEFADIEEFAEDIRPLVDKGLTMEQAYYAVTGGLKKSHNTKSEITREVEAKLRNQKEKAKILDIDTNTSVVEPKERRLKYTTTELAAAKMAGISIEEYKAMQGISSTKEYERYISSKK